MLQSGLPLQRALEHMGSGRDRGADAARGVAGVLDAGPTDAFRQAGFSELDAGILGAGEQSGRLVEACSELAGYYAHLASGQRRALAASAYPVFILHLGAILLSIPPAILQGNFPAFLREVAVFLGTAYAIVGVIGILLWLAARMFSRSAAGDRLISAVPVIGPLLRDGALARFCLVLSLGIRSADGFLAGLARAGEASGSARLRGAAGVAIAHIRSGEGLAAALQAAGAFPADLERALRVAEVSGRLDQEIARWAGIFRDRLFRRIDALTEWLPRILYLVVVALVVFRMFGLISQVTGAMADVLES